MALEMMKNILAFGKSFGSGDPRGDRLALENAALRNVKLKRELSEPSAHDRWQAEKRIEHTKWTFEKLKSFSQDKNLGQAARDNYSSMLENHVFGLTPRMRAMLAPSFRNTVLDPEVKRARWYEEQFGHLRPTKPIDEKGLPLSLTPETGAQWAEFQLRSGQWNHKKMIFMAGSDRAAAGEPPKYVQPIPWIGEGENKTRGPIYSLNPKTNGVESADAWVSQVDWKQAKQWNWTEERCMKENFVPDGAPMNGTYRGQPFRTTPGYEPDTGKKKTFTETYGQPEVKGLEKAKPFLSVFGHLATGTKVDDISNGAEKHIFSILSEYNFKNMSELEFGTALANVNSWVSNNYPTLPFKLAYFRTAREHPFLRPNTIEIDGSNWGLIPADGTRTFSTGDSIYHDSSTDTYTDASGEEVPEAKGTQDGDPIPTNVEVAPEIPKAVQGKTLGDAYVKIIEGLKITEPEKKRLRANIRQQIAGGDPGALNMDDLITAFRETGIALSFLNDFFVTRPGRALTKLIEKLPQLKIPFTGE